MGYDDYKKVKKMLDEMSLEDIGFYGVVNSLARELYIDAEEDHYAYTELRDYVFEYFEEY
ncbi:MAG: hypothetical protein GWN31_15775 [Candidatus Thorarchaeota archaeon]|nr:hypothetical protein [Candidatus Thorarchaeota archaeon]NIW15344.1 hypothetical protein [Candidatus Thorarchaeota archaeon]NIW53304.1 hypothetical protein [Candidatus Korarchaeota archaeon]